MGAPAPRAEKIILAQFTGKMCKCTPIIPSVPPRQRNKSHFRTFLWRFGGGVVDLVVLDRLPRATIKKRLSTFSGKSAPQTKSCYAYVYSSQ